MKKFLSIILTVLMVVTMIPFAPVAFAAAAPDYISKIAVAYGAKESTPKNILTEQGFTIIDYDLNKGCGSSSHYIYMGYKTTKDPSQAITGIFIYEGENPPDSRSFYGTDANLLGGAYETNPGENKAVDLNIGAGGDTIHVYVTRSTSYAPITEIAFSENPNEDGYVYQYSFTDLNSGAGGAYIYLHYKQYSATISGTLYLSLTSYPRRTETFSGTLRTHNDSINAESHGSYQLKEYSKIGSSTSVDDYRNMRLAGWRLDDVAAAPQFTSLSELTVNLDNNGAKFRSVYEHDLKLYYRINTGNVVDNMPETQIQTEYFNIGVESYSAEGKTFTVSSQIPVHATYCSFLGWSTDSEAATPQYQSGDTIFVNTADEVLFPIFDKTHNPAPDDGDCTTDITCLDCGKVTTEGTDHTPAADDDDHTTPVCCLECGKVITEGTDHTPGEYVSDGKKHTLSCTICNTVLETADCSGGTATCTERAVCEKCGNEYGEIDSDVHNWSKNDGICADDCGAKAFETKNDATIDTANGYIYGLDAGADSLDSYTNVLVEDCEWSYTLGQFGGFGTGTKATLKNGDTTVAEYTILIYGDVNGDGWYDGEDAFLVNLIVAGMLTQENLPDYMWTAADCNHDDLIDEIDVDLLMGAGLKKNDIDQNTAQSELSIQAAYIDYMSIIDQSAGLDVEPDTDDSEQGTTTLDTNEDVEPDESAEDSDFGIFISKVFLFIRKIFNLVISFVIK